MAPTPSSSSKLNHHFKTPQSKPHRLQFRPSPNPNSAARENPNPNANPPDHPVEVIARIRDYPDRKDQPISTLQINPQKQSIRLRADFGYRDFTLDGVSLSEEEDLEAFYTKFVQSRINSVKLGDKCTVMMYGPTGSGKSHTMFGCSKQPGIVYRALKDILWDEEEDGDADGERVGVGTFVQVTVLEIYNEEIYDLLSSNGGGGGLWPKGNGSNSKVKLEVMGKKAKNATFIFGNEAGKISKEIQKVEKRRIVKSTLCNDRSSRSHCMVILDVPTVGGRLMLVDMAGSENIEQAGQIGFEAKMQTAKINQGNIALKRVVESIANGDSHVPFRDSKLTMLLQDSFEDDKSKILMILCASPDPAEIHKTISTLEYGAKAKCIVRGPHTPVKDGGEDSSSAVILGLRIAAMDEFITKLQKENKLREKEKNEAQKQLMKKEEEVAVLRAGLESIEAKGSVNEEEISIKVNERTESLKCELEKKLEECQKMANDFVELERRRMEERMLQQQQEVEMLRQRLEQIELELRSKDGKDDAVGKSMDGSGFVNKLFVLYGNDDATVKSMDLDMDDPEPFVREVKHVGGFIQQTDSNGSHNLYQTSLSTFNAAHANDPFAPTFAPTLGLTTVYEEVEEEEDEEPTLGLTTVYEGEEVEEEEDEEPKVKGKPLYTLGLTTVYEEEVEEEEDEEPTLGLTTVYEGEEVEEEEDEEPKVKGKDEEVEKEIIEEKRVCVVDGSKRNLGSLAAYIHENSENTPIPELPSKNPEEDECLKERTEDRFASLGLASAPQDDNKNSASSRHMRIQNIFTLCGNHRELLKHIRTPLSAKKMSENIDPQTKGTQSPSHPSQTSVPLRSLDNTITLTPNACYLPELGDHLNSTPFITLRRSRH